MRAMYLYCRTGVWEVCLFSSPEPKAQGELIVWDSSRRPSVRPFTLSNIDISETKRANHNQILSGASLGWGIDCIRFSARSDQSSGFHGNR